MTYSSPFKKFMFPSPRGDELFQGRTIRRPKVNSFRPLAGMSCFFLPHTLHAPRTPFPSPRGDELFQLPSKYLRTYLPGFRPLAGMSCFSKSRQKSHKIFRAFCKDSPFEPFFAAQIMNTFPPNVDYLCANRPKIPFCLPIIPQGSHLGNNIFPIYCQKSLYMVY